MNNNTCNLINSLLSTITHEPLNDKFIIRNTINDIRIDTYKLLQNFYEVRYKNKVLIKWYRDLNKKDNIYNTYDTFSSGYHFIYNKPYLMNLFHTNADYNLDDIEELSLEYNLEEKEIQEIKDLHFNYNTKIETIPEDKLLKLIEYKPFMDAWLIPSTRNVLILYLDDIESVVNEFVNN